MTPKMLRPSRLALGRRKMKLTLVVACALGDVDQRAGDHEGELHLTPSQSEPRRSQHFRRHAPRKRGIQYSRASTLNLERHGVLDRPLSRTMTAKNFGRTDRSRPVIAVDCDVFLGEVAGQHAVAALAETEPDLDLDLRVLHRSRHFRLVLGRS